MNVQAFVEALVAVAVTPVVSAGMALVVIAGIIALIRKADRQ